jgi:hypothetical protein
VIIRYIISLHKATCEACEGLKSKRPLCARHVTKFGTPFCTVVRICIYICLHSSQLRALAAHMCCQHPYRQAFKLKDCQFIFSSSSHFFLQRSQSSYSYNTARKASTDSNPLAKCSGQKIEFVPTDMNGNSPFHRRCSVMSQQPPGMFRTIVVEIAPLNLEHTSIKDLCS